VLTVKNLVVVKLCCYVAWSVSFVFHTNCLFCIGC